MNLYRHTAILAILLAFQGCSVQEASDAIKKKHPGILQNGGNIMSLKLPPTPMKNPFKYTLPSNGVKNPFAYKLPATPMKNPLKYTFPAPK